MSAKVGRRPIKKEPYIPHISQDIVVTGSKCGRMFSDEVIVNLLPRPMMKAV